MHNNRSAEILAVVRRGPFAKPTEIEQLEKKLEDIEKKLKEYMERKEKQITLQQKKREEWRRKHRMIVEDSWGMMRWLTQFIEENKFEWERRREREREPTNEELEKYTKMEEEEMIQIMKAESIRILPHKELEMFMYVVLVELANVTSDNLLR